jgi:hypothetical protein
MGRLMDSEELNKEKITLAVVKYLLLAIFFFPLTFLLWYSSNRGKVSFGSSFAACVSVFSISAASYIYVLKPLAKHHMDFGIYGAVIYGGFLTMIFFLSRLTYPGRATAIYSIAYYFGYMVLTVSTIFWTVVPRYYLAHGVDKGTVLLAILGLSWFIISILINNYDSPTEEGIAVIKPPHMKMTLFLIWLLAIGNCSLLKLILSASQRLP